MYYFVQVVFTYFISLDISWNFIFPKYRYIAWNIHEPRPGQYNFKNDSDIESFIRLVNSLELLLIVRPGKYQQYVVESATRSAVMRMSNFTFGQTEKQSLWN